MFVPRLVASDLDGTLLRSDHLVAPRTLATLARLRDEGVPFVMVTGRPIRWIPPVVEQTGPVGPVVCANGSVVLDETATTVLAEWTIAPDVLAETTARLRETTPGLAFAVERGPLMLHEPHYPVRWDLGFDSERVAGYDEVVAEAAAKLLIRVVDGDPYATFDRVSAVLDGVVTPTHSGFPGLIEVTASGVTKATGLAWVAERHGVDAGGVLAFGDMPNDVPMLRWAGRGVVVAGAHPDAFDAADAVTTGNDADGVAAYVDALLDEAATREQATSRE
jgi:Cof subfamily protein (haloacid dehalogenase superfamily)